MTNYERCKHMSIEEMAVALAMNDDPNEFLLFIPMYYTWLKAETKITPTDFDNIIEVYKDKFVIEDEEDNPYMTLPNKEEYIESREGSALIHPSIKWSEPKYICPKCKEGGMQKDLLTAICLASLPPQYRYTYKCNKCDYTEELGV